MLFFVLFQYSDDECTKFADRLQKVIGRNPVREYTDANLVVWRRHNSEFQALDMWFYQDLKDTVYENPLYDRQIKTQMRQVMEIGLDAIELFEEREVRRLTTVVGSYVEAVLRAMTPDWDNTVKTWISKSSDKQKGFSRLSEADRIKGILTELEGDEEDGFTKKSASKAADAKHEQSAAVAPASVPRRATIRGSRPVDSAEDDLFDDNPTPAAPAASMAASTSHTTTGGYPAKLIGTFCEETKIAIAGFKTAFTKFAGHFFTGAFPGMGTATAVTGSNLQQKQAKAKELLYAEYFYNHMNSLRQSELRKFTGNQVETLNEVEEIRIKLAKIGAKVTPTEVSQLKVSWTHICVLHGNCQQ